MICVYFQAEQLIQDLEKKYEKKIEDFMEESQQNLLRVQEEHAASVCYHVDLKAEYIYNYKFFL